MELVSSDRIVANNLVSHGGGAEIAKLFTQEQFMELKSSDPIVAKNLNHFSNNSFSQPAAEETQPFKPRM